MIMMEGVERKKGGRETDKENLSSIPQVLIIARAGPGPSQDSGPPPRSPMWMAGPGTWNIFCGSPRTWEDVLIWDIRDAGSSLTFCDTVPVPGS